jgi:hypothetical protein
LPSFTSTVPNLQAVGPIVEIRIAPGASLTASQQASGVAPPAPLAALAMIDTGASGSVIQKGLAGQLGLNPIGLTYINTPSSTNVACYEYAVRLIFPNNVFVEATVLEAPLQGQNIQCLIGRDVLALGVLVYIGYGNLFSLSF